MKGVSYDRHALPPRPNLDQYKKQAKDLLKNYQAGHADALSRISEHHPLFNKAASTNHQVVINVMWSSDERRAYSCDWNGGIRVWDLT